MLNKLINNYDHDHTTNCRYFIIGIISLGNLLLLLSGDNISHPQPMNSYVIFTFPLEQDCPQSPV